MKVAIAAAGETPVERPAKILWFVTSSGFEHSIHGSTALLSVLQQLLGGNGWQVRHRVMSYGHSENRSSQWDRLLDAERPDAMIVWAGRDALAVWARLKGLRTLFLGGSRQGTDLPMLAVKSVEMVDRAVKELVGRGHERLFLPMCNRPASMVKSVRATVARCIRGPAGAAKQMVPESSYEAGSVIEAMVGQALRERAPTGWIFYDWREYLAASCVFRDHGLAIPRDLSAVILSWDPAMDWYRPAPAHFRQPLERMAKAAAEWALGEGEESGTRYFLPEWMPGESLTAAVVSK